MLKLRFLLILVASGLFLLWLLDRASDDEVLNIASEYSPLAEDYDYYISDMSTTRFAATGQPDYRLQAARVTHFPEGDLATLEAPHFTYYQDQAQPWQVTADNGTLSPDMERGEDRLDLLGQVLLRQDGDNGNYLEVHTEALTAYPDLEEVSTDIAVTLLTQDTKLDSIGMRALMRQEQVELLNNVRGYHGQTAHEQTERLP